ncbi:hypothetical protein [Rufibacter roseus]|uniref:Uncharacterized protein n=1 Tax=Rufibacter roseus TaxID=1567108 RepID=A0ABW2DUY6_9BACT|nr:hypothetical protein [Rufibacter roseus]
MVHLSEKVLSFVKGGYLLTDIPKIGSTSISIHQICNEFTVLTTYEEPHIDRYVYYFRNVQNPYTILKVDYNHGVLKSILAPAHFFEDDFLAYN